MKALTALFAMTALGVFIAGVNLTSAEIASAPSQVGGEITSLSPWGKTQADVDGVATRSVIPLKRVVERCMKLRENCCQIDGAGMCTAPNPSDPEAVGCCPDSGLICASGKCEKA